MPNPNENPHAAAAAADTTAASAQAAPPANIPAGGGLNIQSLMQTALANPNPESGVAALEKLQLLWERDRQFAEAEQKREDAAEMNAAICRATANFGEIKKTEQGQNHKYASLDVIKAAIDLPLTNEGISYRFATPKRLDENKKELPPHVDANGTTWMERAVIVKHSRRVDGVMRSAEIVIRKLMPLDWHKGDKRFNISQAVGVMDSYSARYLLNDAFGLAAVGDTDGVFASAKPSAKEAADTQGNLAKAFLQVFGNKFDTKNAALMAAVQFNSVVIMNPTFPIPEGKVTKAERAAFYSEFQQLVARDCVDLDSAQAFCMVLKTPAAGVFLRVIPNISSEIANALAKEFDTLSRPIWLAASAPDADGSAGQ